MRCKWCGRGDASGPYHGGCLDAKLREQKGLPIILKARRPARKGLWFKVATFNGAPLPEGYLARWEDFKQRMARRGVVIK
jgi:hypothetical protein